MGCYSTMEITATDARVEILKRLLTCSNETLENTLFELMDRHNLYNFKIVDEYTEVGPNEFDAPYTYKAR
jgi:hypothetical protein